MADKRHWVFCTTLIVSVLTLGNAEDQQSGYVEDLKRHSTDCGYPPNGTYVNKSLFQKCVKKTNETYVPDVCDLYLKEVERLCHTSDDLKVKETAEETNEMLGNHIHVCDVAKRVKLSPRVGKYMHGQNCAFSCYASGAREVCRLLLILYLTGPTSFLDASMTAAPTTTPTEDLTTVPAAVPTKTTTEKLTTVPAAVPTKTTTEKLTTVPAAVPTQTTTEKLTTVPAAVPTKTPTEKLTTVPAAVPTKTPTEKLTTVPAAVPTKTTTEKLTTGPEAVPTTLPAAKQTGPPKADKTGWLKNLLYPALVLIACAILFLFYRKRHQILTCLKDDPESSRSPEDGKGRYRKLPNFQKTVPSLQEIDKAKTFVY